MKEQAALAGRIRLYLSELDRVVERIQMLAGKALHTGDDGYWDGVALNLHGYYSGLERIFEDIARTVDESLPEGPDWHRTLLVQMTATVPKLRPAVISGETRFALDEFRGFRHVVRNVYAFNFRPARLKELVDHLENCHHLVQKELQEFAGFLDMLQ